MPAVIAAELYYEGAADTYYIDSYEFTNSLPQIKENYYVFGELEFCKIDKKREKEISEPVELQLKERARLVLNFESKELIKKLGITPNSWICLALDSYSMSTGEYADKYPIYPDYFEIIKTPGELQKELENKFKGPEEIWRLLKLKGVENELKDAYKYLENAYLKHREKESPNFPDVKSNIRKVLTVIKKFTASWKTIDGSQHLAAHTDKLAKSLYNLGCTGGGHGGPAGLYDTELIFNSTLYLFRYVNQVIKSGNFERKVSTKK